MATEVVIFRLQSTATETEFLATVDETTALLKTQPGFISRTIGKAESGEWLDILYWDTVEAAKKAAEAFQTDPAGKRFSAYLDPQHIQVFYLEAIAHQQ